MDWYYVVGGQQYGPVEESALYRLAKEGRLKPDDLIWNQDLGDKWAAASSLAGLFEQPGITPLPLTVAAPLPPAGGTGTTPNVELMQQAKKSLEGNWGVAIGALLIYHVITGGLSAIPNLGLILCVIVDGPLRVGLLMIFLTIARRREPDINLIFKGFNCAWTGIAASLLTTLFILLWSLLLIVPGIIAALSYAMTFYIIADNPEIKASEAIGRSKQMMVGRRMKYLGLQCRFIGWVLLGVFTCGIGFLYVMPYMSAATAHFYEDIREAPLQQT